MKNYRREYPYFSLCGLNCGLCPIHNMQNGCPGCGGGDGHQSCKIVTCSLAHGGVEYCFQCADFPCAEHYGADAFDSFIPCRNRHKDFETARTQGLPAYRAQLDEKVSILSRLLEGYNDGRRKSFFCTAVNLLPLEDVRQVMGQIEEQAPLADPLKARAAAAAKLFQDWAEEKGLSLKLRKKPRA